jgi:toxin ParE1/3/4
MKLKWSSRALADQQQIIDFYAEIDAGLALEMIDRVEAAANKLVDFPEMGRPGRVSGTREWPIKKSPFVAVYITGSNEVRVLRILHAAMMWPGE